MKKPLRPLCLLATAATFLTSAPAIGGGGGAAIYERTYYSDASHQTQVGERIFRQCEVDFMGNDVVVYDKIGTQTVYYTQQMAGWCMDGEYFDP